jgi:hypothetical protein
MPVRPTGMRPSYDIFKSPKYARIQSSSYYSKRVAKGEQKTTPVIYVSIT